MPKKVVEKSSQDAPAKKKLYKKGKYPYTVVKIATKQLFVRKSKGITETVFDSATGTNQTVRKQKQIWRLCEPPTSERVNEILKEIETDIYFEQTGAVRPLSNFGEILDEFETVELVEAIYEKGQKIAGRRSLDAPRAIIKILRQYFGASEISHITFGDIEKFKIARLKTPVESKYKPPRARALRSVNYELSFLRQVFNFAYRRRWLDRSPFADGREIINAAAETRRHVAWTREEEKKALALCTGRIFHLKAVIVLITDAGFRWGEIAGAKWSDYDDRNDFIDVGGYKNKNRIVRRVYITERIKAVLRVWKAEQKKRFDESTRRGWKTKLDPNFIIGFKSVKNAWLRLARDLGRPDLHIHDLRHVFATRLYYEAKVELGLVSQALGHSSIKTTEIYVNAQTSDVRDAVRKLGALHEKD